MGQAWYLFECYNSRAIKFKEEFRINTMIKSTVAKIYSIVNISGEILFLNDAYIAFANLDRNQVIGRKAMDLLSITPKLFALAQASKDRRDIINGKKELIRREAIIASEKRFAIVTNDKLPLIDSGNIIGVINETDTGIEQLVQNRCFLNLKPMHYRGEVFGVSDMKLLCMLAQFEGIKPSDISSALKLKMNTVYMYRHNLLNKINNIFSGEKYNMADIAKDMFFEEQVITGQKILCIAGKKIVPKI
ncbi:PAS domain-containing protein [Piscirickettsia salmonis]